MLLGRRCIESADFLVTIPTPSPPLPLFTPFTLFTHPFLVAPCGKTDPPHLSTINCNICPLIHRSYISFWGQHCHLDQRLFQKWNELRWQLEFRAISLFVKNWLQGENWIAHLIYEIILQNILLRVSWMFLRDSNVWDTLDCKIACFVLYHKLVRSRDISSEYYSVRGIDCAEYKFYILQSCSSGCLVWIPIYGGINHWGPQLETISTARSGGPLVAQSPADDAL